MDVMREWEEFEKEYESTVCVEDELQRQIRQERKVTEWRRHGDTYYSYNTQYITLHI